MIKQIQLENFQAHKKTTLNLHPGVNVIAGSSNSGKSSILRALNWTVYNRPSGDAFVSHWARDAKGNQNADTAVTLVMDKCTIERRKSKATGNTYSVDGKVLEAIGLDVPEEVSTAINFSEVNTQRQHDAPFLLSESPGEVARFFNRIVHFDAIDKYMSLLESKKRKTKADGEHAKEQLERLTKELDKYDWIGRAEEILTRLTVLDEEYAQHLVKLDALANSIVQYNDYSEKLPAYSSILSRSKKLIASIEEISSKLEVASRDTQLHTETVRAYKQHLQTSESEVNLAYAEKLIKKIDRLQPLLTDFQHQKTGVKISIEDYRANRETFKGMDGQIDELVASLPKTCPTCGKELDDEVCSHG